MANVKNFTHRQHNFNLTFRLKYDTIMSYCRESINPHAVAALYFPVMEGPHGGL